MNIFLRKIAACAMAITTLSVCTTGFSASAVTPRYGGTSTFIVNGETVEKYIDGYKTSAAASTRCDASSCNSVYVSVSGYYTNTQHKYDWNSNTRGLVSVSFPAESGSEFIKVTSCHSATVNGVNDTKTMTVNL